MLQLSSLTILYRAHPDNASILPTECGIYIIPNIVNGDFYVGSSVDLRKRWTNHVWDLHHDRHANPKLQAAWHAYGPAAFEFVVIELTNNQLPREQYWLDYFNVTGRSDCYNLCGKAGSHLGMKRSPETREKQRQARLGKRHDVETKRKIAATMTGKTMPPRSEEYRLKFRKLPPAQVAELFALKAQGLSVPKVALRAGLPYTTVRKVLSGESYRGVAG